MFGLDRDGVVARLRERARSLMQSDPNVFEVRLFGSLARGDAGPGSDADLLLVVEECSLPPLERTSIYARFFEDVGVGCDILVYTRSEMESPANRNVRFLRVLDAESLVLARR